MRKDILPNPHAPTSHPLCATVGYSDIESANIVGYTAKDAEKGMFKIFSAPFEAVAGGSDLNVLISSGVPGTDYDEDGNFMQTAAQVQIPNAGGSYDTYYFLNDAWYDNGTEEGGLKPGWADDYGTLVDAELTTGVAYWFKSVSASANPTVAGQVPQEDAIDVSCPNGFALRANPFPVAVDLNGDKVSSKDIVGIDYDEDGNFMTTASQVQIPNAGGSYDTYYFLNDAWYDNGTEEGGLKPGWADDYGTLVEAQVPVMQGFWTKGVSGEFTLTFTR